MTGPEGAGPRAQWWRLALAVFIGVIGILLSSAAWSALRSTERARIEAALETTAAELVLAFESGFRSRLENLRDLGSSWGRSGTEDLDRWQAEAKLFRELHEECLALEWDRRALPGSSLVSGTPDALDLLATRRADPEAESARRVAIEARPRRPWDLG